MVKQRNFCAYLRGDCSEAFAAWQRTNKLIEARLELPNASEKNSHKALWKL